MANRSPFQHIPLELMTNNDQIESITRLVENAILDKVFPCVEILAARGEEILYHQVFGNRIPDDPSTKLEKNSLFDLASLTKPLATTNAILHLCEQASISLETPVYEIIPEFANQDDKTRITIRHLLTHTSGLPDWLALYEPRFDKQQGWNLLLSTPLIKPPGEITIYSCLGFILLGEIIRRLSALSLNEYCRKYLFNPMQLRYTRFNPDPLHVDIPIVPTGYCSLRKVTLSGIVHDENAALFDGEGGNSGLFGTAQETHKICLMLLNNGKFSDHRILPKRSVNSLFQNHNPSPLIPRSLGWDYKTGEADYWSCSHQMPDGSIGHLGFTGTSLWVDPDSKFIFIALSNRVFISREDNIPLMQIFRPNLHRLLLEHLG